MTRSRLLLFAVVTALLSSPGPAYAGAWTREDGTSFVSLTYDRWFTDERFGTDGERGGMGTLPGDEYRGQALHGYFEHGLTDEWTVVAGVSFVWIESEYSGRLFRNTGFSDLTFQLKRRILAAPFVLSVQAETRVPAGYSRSEFPALGAGVMDAGGRVLAGGSAGRLYLTGEAGFNARGGSRSDVIPYAVEAGLRVWGDALVRADLRGTATARSIRGAAGAFDPATADSRYTSAGLAVVLPGEPLEVAIGVEHALAGQNTLAGTKLLVGVWKR